jgi:predicted phage terminase large subunit-like protein
LRKSIDDKTINAIYKEYPLVDADDKMLWPGKFSSMAEIDEFKRIIGNEKAWQREYMLKIIADDDQIVLREWIQHYDELPNSKTDYRYTIIAVDLAISSASTADYTAMVIAHVYGHTDTMRVYILPNPVNERLDFPKTLERIKLLADKSGLGTRAHIYVEDVGYQKSVIQQLKHDGYHVKGFPVNGQDKRARLTSVTPLVMLGKVLFPRGTADKLINQLINFGVEKHDDLVDAFTILLHSTIDQDRPPVKVLDRELYDLFRGWSRDYGSDYWSRRDPGNYI